MIAVAQSDEREPVMHQAWVNAKQELAHQQLARDGSLLSLCLGTVILGTVYYNAQILHDDYPPAIKAKAVPMTEQDKRERVLASVLFLGSFIGGIVRSNVRLRARNNSQLSFLAAFINAYTL